MLLGLDLISPLEVQQPNRSSKTRFKRRMSNDPFFDWCETHSQELARYPDSYVAISLEDGVVVSAKTDKEFAEKLRNIDPVRKKSLFRTHTSRWS